VSKLVTIIAFVSHYCSRYIICQQGLCLLVIALLANGEDKSFGIALGIATGVNLGAETTLAAA